VGPITRAARAGLRRFFSAPAGYALLAAFPLLSSWLFFPTLFPAGTASLSAFFSVMPWVLLPFAQAVALRTRAEVGRPGAEQAAVAFPRGERGAALGEFLAGLAVIAVALGLTFQAPAAVSALGDLDPGPLAGGYLGLLLLGASYLAVSRLASAITGSRIAAFVAGAAMSLALLVIGDAGVLRYAPAWLGVPLRHIGLSRHVASMARGVVDSGDLVYVAGVTAFFLFAALTVIAARGGTAGAPTDAPGRARARAAGRIVAAAALLAVVSAVSVGRPVRADLTARKQFTISMPSKSMLAALPDVVTVTACLSEDVPRRLTDTRVRIEGLLDEYRRYGGGRVRVRVVDPSRDAEAEAVARSAGILPLQFQSLEGDRAVPRAVYLGAMVEHAGRKETIPTIADAGRLEYDLTLAILKVVTDRRPVVAFLTGHGERSILGDYSRAADALRESYDVRETGAGGLAPGGGITTLVAAGPDHLPDSELYEIDQFLMRGGRALFLLDGARVATAGEFRSEPGRGNIYAFVGRYGAVVGSDLVVDMVNSPAAFTRDEVQLTAPYPYWPKAFGPNISRDHPVVSEFDAITFPWTSSITVGDAAAEAATVTVLARSSDRSWSVPALEDVRPLSEIPQPSGAVPGVVAGEGGHLPLAVAVSGKLTSAFEGSPVIQERGGKVEFTEPAGRITSGITTQIVVIGNARMFENALLGKFSSNLALFRSIVDWLTLGDTLAGIRVGRTDDRPLRTVGGAGRTAAAVLGSVTAPACVAAFGLGRAAARRRRSPAIRA
jgi:ABC-type uncharacterized transport system involved in gliding motility auxiliary subunit